MVVGGRVYLGRGVEVGGEAEELSGDVSSSNEGERLGVLEVDLAGDL